MNPFTKIQPIPIKNLPQNWIVVGDPIRARDIAHKHFKSPQAPAYSDGYTSIWICRAKSITFGIMSAGMGSSSVRYSLSRVPVQTVVRIGTCGYHDPECKFKIVNCNICYNDSTEVIHGITHAELRNVSCLSTDLLYHKREITTVVEDMESYTVLKYFNNSASLLYCVNRIYVNADLRYANDVFYPIADYAIDIIKDFNKGVYHAITSERAN